MTSPVALDLVSLDYDDIKTSLKNALAATQEFANYDFDAGGGAAILKVLAYVSWNNAYMLHQAASEAFLDSAQRRESVASHAKALGYLPTSARSAHARVRMTWTGESPIYYLRRGQEFAALIKGSSATSFSIAETQVVTGEAGEFEIELDVYEGTYVSDAWIATDDDAQRFVISNEIIDTDSVAVYVSSGVATPEEWERVTTLLSVNELSKVWFLQLSETGRYEVLFGTGVAGARPPVGSRVVVEYRITHGSAGNGARRFTTTFNPYPEDATNIEVITIDASAGGEDAETVEDIRFRAPRHFRVQERAVTADDYAVLLSGRFAEINDVYAYGGERADPPRYGVVFIAIDLADAAGVSESRRALYEDFLSDRAALTTRPIVIDPERAWVNVTSAVSYDPSLETVTGQAVRALVSTAIATWADDNLGRFRSRLRLSKLIAAIDGAHDAIVSNDTTYAVYKKVAPINAVWSGQIKFGFAIENTPVDTDRVLGYTVWSATFANNGLPSWIADDGEGALWLVQGGQYVSQIGTVDYDDGIIELVEEVPTAGDGALLKIYVKPRDTDLVPGPDTVVELGDLISVTVRAI